MKLNVSIIEGDHTMRIPVGMKKMLVDMLKEIGFTQGEFKIHLGENILGTPHTKGVKFVCTDEVRNAFIVTVQPGSNDTRHRCMVYLPGHYRDEAALYFKKVSELYGKADETEKEADSFIETISTEQLKLEKIVQLDGLFEKISREIELRTEKALAYEQQVVALQAKLNEENSTIASLQAEITSEMERASLTLKHIKALLKEF